MAAFRDANATVSAHGAVAVTASDVTVFPVTRALYVGVTGAIAVRMADGQTVTFANVPVGVFPVQVDMVLSTGTVATDLFRLYQNVYWNSTKSCFPRLGSNWWQWGCGRPTSYGGWYRCFTYGRWDQCYSTGD